MNCLRLRDDDELMLNVNTSNIELLVSLIIFFLYSEYESPSNPGCTADGGNLDGPCIFPWKWGGKSYNKCANPDNSRWPWCGTRLHKAGNIARWGFCNADCFEPNNGNNFM